MDIESGIWEEFKDRGLLVYGANRESEEVLRNFIDQTGITFPVLEGEPNGYFLLGGQSPYPRDYIIDAEGIVQYADTEYRPTEMTAIIEKLLPTGLEGEQGTPGLPGPGRVSMSQNAPNPFNPSTEISFQLQAEEASRVRLSIYNLRGNRVRRLIDQDLAPGDHSARWDGRDDLGKELPSGLYLYSLEAQGEKLTRRMLLLK